MLKFEGAKNYKAKTTLNDIPVGVVFEGDMYSSRRGRWISGIWLRTATHNGVYAVGLYVRDVETERATGVFQSDSCETVENYRPLRNPKIVED